jgi:hypothetical protein
MSNESLSGQFAAIDGVPAIVSWNIARTRPSNAFKHSGTNGGTNRRKGVGSWSGGWTAKGGVPAVLPGASASFIGYTAPTTGVEGTDGFRYSGTIFVNEVTIRWDWTTNAVIDHDVSFLGHLGLTKASGTAVTDAVQTVEVESSLCAILAGTVAAPTAITDMKTAQLKITSDVKPFVNSSTANETGHRGGKLIDWEAQIVVENTDGTLFTEGTEFETLRMGVNAAQFWDLQQAFFREMSGVTANRETGDIIEQTLTFEMASNKAADGTLGAIVKPDTNNYWP